MRRLATSILLSVFVLASPAFAANYVSGFTIGSSVVGGSTQQANAVVTVTRDPGSNDALAIQFVTPPGVSVVCPPGTQNGLGGGYCNMPAGQSTFTYYLAAGFVSSDTTVNVTAKNSGNPGDTGVTAQLTIQAMRSAVSISPGSLIGGGLDSANAHVYITNGTPASDVSIYLTVSPAYGYPTPKGSSSNPLLIPAGSSSVDTTFMGSTVTTPQTVTVTPSFGPNPGTATVTIYPGAAPASTQMGHCVECERAAGHPIDLISGNTWLQQQDYSVPGLGALSLVRTWNSLWTVNSPPQTIGMFGHSWTSNLEERIQVVNPSTTKYWRGDGKVIQYSYDSMNQIYVLVSPPEAHIALTYDPILQQYTVQFVGGERRLFNSAGQLTAILDRNNNQTTLTYDASNRLSLITDPAGRTLTITYPDPSSTLVQSVADSVGTVATYAYDGSSRLTQVTYPDTYITFAYDANSLLLNVKDSAGKILEAHTYDASRRGMSSQKANGVEAVNISSYNPTYTYFTNSLGGSSNVGFYKLGTGYYVKNYYSSGCATCTLVPGGNTFTYVVDSSGNRTESIDPLGRWTAQTFDLLGNVTSWKRALGSSNYAEWDYTYNGFGEVLTATDPLGHTTTNAYDGNGNLLSTTTPSPDGVQPGSTTSFTYDSHGLLLTVTDPLNHTTTMTYTPAGLVASVTDAQNNVTAYQYDARGNRTSVTDALSHTTAFAYDSRNRLTTITYPDSTTTTFTYDTRGRRTSVTDGNNKTTTYAYDDADRLTSVTDAANNVTRYGYDNESQLTSITDANNHTTSFTYTTGRLTKTTFPSTLYESYTYDSIGNLATKVDRKSQQISYFYDNFDRLSYKYIGYYVYYTYDKAGRLTQVQDNTGSNANYYNFAYDNIGRLKQTTTQYSFLSGHTYMVSYAYDAAGNRTTMTDPANGVSNYGYDSLNRLTSLSDFNSNSFGFSYDALSRRMQLTRPNGITSNYAYDNLSRLLSVLHQLGGTTVDGATYTYDNAGNRTTKSNQATGITENYTYDPIYQLTQVVQGLNNTTEAYSYDPVGNRLSTVSDTGWSYDSSNHLTARTGVSYTYDNDGNTKTKVDSNGTTSYAWNYENQLTSVTLPGTGGTVTFKYDPFGRRIQKVSPSGTTNYLYDGANAIEEVDGTGTVLARYGQGVGIDEPLSDVAGGAAKFYQADGLASITALADISGSATDAYVTDAFGNTTTSAGTTRNPFRYTARELDSETGLMYYRARYYDPVVGRFLSEDPAGVEGGINLYEYAKANPLRFRDPMGLTPTISLPGISSWTEAEELAYAAYAKALQGGSKALFSIETATVTAVAYLFDPSSDNNARWANSQELQFEVKCTNSKDCKKASDWHLSQAGIVDPHEFKRDFLGRNYPISQWDICACKDGSIVLRKQGQCGKPGPTIDTGVRWKQGE